MCKYRTLFSLNSQRYRRYSHFLRFSAYGAGAASIFNLALRIGTASLMDLGYSILFLNSNAESEHSFAFSSSLSQILLATGAKLAPHCRRY